MISLYENTITQTHIQASNNTKRFQSFQNLFDSIYTRKQKKIFKIYFTVIIHNNKLGSSKNAIWNIHLEIKSKTFVFHLLKKKNIIIRFNNKS